MRVDSTGKVSLDHIYTEPNPRAYFTTLRGLEYQVPQVAKPHFEGLVEDYRRATGVAVPQILDIGCSYGINAALVKYNATMDELYERYCDGPRRHEAVLARDRELVRSRTPRAVRFVGLDQATGKYVYNFDESQVYKRFLTDPESRWSLQVGFRYSF